MSRSAVTAPSLTLGPRASLTDVSTAIADQTIQLAADTMPRSGDAVVVSGFAWWSLMSSLAPYAPDGGPIAGIDRDLAATAFDAVQDWTTAHPELSSAVGLWVMPHVVVRPGVDVSRLTGPRSADQSRLDRWAREATRGLIADMPLRLDRDTDVVAAHASACETSWQAEFRPRRSLSVAQGPWEGTRISVMSREQRPRDLGMFPDSSGNDRLLVCGIRGQTLDLWVACGDDDLLQAVRGAVDAATGRRSPRPAFDLADGRHGPVEISTRPSPDPHDHAYLTCPPFDITSVVDVTEAVRSLGLLIGISPTPLALNEAAVTQRARFHETGFEAGSVAEAEFAVLAAEPAAPRGEERVAVVTLDRPFAFAAVERSTRFCLYAGWITDPAFLAPGAGP